MSSDAVVTSRNAPWSKDGRLWKKRIRRATLRRDRALMDVAELRQLYTIVYEQREKWGVSVPIARTIVDAIVGDTYVRNPDPFIQSRQPNADPDYDKKARDLAKTLHDETKTQTILQHGMIVAAYAGLAGHWTDFQQEHHYEDVDATNEDGAVVGDGRIDELNGSGPRPAPAAPAPSDVTPSPTGPRRILRADKQKVIAQLVMPHEFVVDPDGNNWDLSDSKWIAREYAKSLDDIEHEAQSPETGYDAGQVAKLRGWIGSQSGQRRNTTTASIDSSSEEKDPAYRMVYCWEIWSRVEKMIYHVPVGADFHIASYPWPDAWAQADEYPLTIIAFNWQPPDQWGNGGFYALPDLRLVRSPLENLPRLEAVYLDSCTNYLRKWLSVGGLLTTTQKTEIQSDKNRQWIDVDLDVLIKKFNSGSPIDLMSFDFSRLIYSLQENEAAQAVKHLEAIEHQLDMIYKLLGVGPTERAGMVETKSATESLGIQQRLSARIEKRVEEAADIADQITKKQFICLKSSATLPVRYLRAAGMNEALFAEFPAPDLWDIDVVIKHHVGSSRPPTRDQEKAERRELFALAAPVLQGMGAVQQVMEWLWWVAVPYDQDFANRMLQPQLSGQAQQIVALLDEINNGGAELNPQMITQLLAMLGTFFGGYLSDAQLQQVAQQQVQKIGSNAPAPAQRGTGSLAKPASPGGAAATRASAAAGAIGGRS